MKTVIKFAFLISLLCITGIRAEARKYHLSLLRTSIAASSAKALKIQAKAGIPLVEKQSELGSAYSTVQEKPAGIFSAISKRPSASHPVVRLFRKHKSAPAEAIPAAAQIRTAGKPAGSVQITTGASMISHGLKDIGIGLLLWLLSFLFLVAFLAAGTGAALGFVAVLVTILFILGGVLILIGVVRVLLGLIGAATEPTDPNANQTQPSKPPKSRWD